MAGAGGSVGSAGTGPRCAGLVGSLVAWSPTSSSGLGLGGASGDGVGVDVPAGVAAWTASTGRNANRAVVPTSSTSSSLLTLGAATSIWSLPCTVTDASPTPSESTRCWMIVRAVSRFSRGGELPSDVRAVRVMVVPPRRSRPSRGSQLPVMAIRPNSIATTTPTPISVRVAPLVLEVVATRTIPPQRFCRRSSSSSTGETTSSAAGANEGPAGGASVMGRSWVSGGSAGCW